MRIAILSDIHGNCLVTWSRDWSEAMTAAISEEAFAAYRSQLISQIGPFQSHEPAKILPGEAPGYVRWSTIAHFENGRIRFNFSFTEDGKIIEGVFPEVVEMSEQG